MTTLTRNPDGIAELVRSAETVALCAHVNPDGDTVGSTLALKIGLETLGKQVRLFCQDKIPDNLMLLPGAGDFRTPESAQGQRFDLLIAVDVSDPGRMGDCQCLLNQAKHTAQIDHHGTNPAYAEVNSVDGQASATGLMVRQQLEALGVPVSRDIAMCLYAAISTDTGNFAFSCTSAEAFSVMSELMACGLPLSEMNRRLFRQRDKAQLLLMARALDSLRFFADDRVTLMTLTRQDFADCGALPEHADTIVNFGLDVSGVKLAALARETDRGVKCSLRAVEPARVDTVAAAFGGGGHAQAAGCTIEATLQNAADRVVAALVKSLEEDNA